MSTLAHPDFAEIASLTRGMLDRIVPRDAVVERPESEARGYEALYALGRSLYLQGRCEEAATAFEFIVLHNSRERRYIIALGAALQMGGKHVEAIGQFMRAVFLDAEDPEPVFHMCECLVAMGHPAEARDALAMVVQRCGDERHAELRERAQAMFQLLTAPTVQTQKENSSCK